MTKGSRAFRGYIPFVNGPILNFVVDAYFHDARTLNNFSTHIFGNLAMRSQLVSTFHDKVWTPGGAEVKGKVVPR
jgi:hypothetical protein